MFPSNQIQYSNLQGQVGLCILKKWVGDACRTEATGAVSWHRDILEKCRKTKEILAMFASTDCNMNTALKKGNPCTIQLTVVLLPLLPNG
jgi:hypothetical protein